MVPACLCRFLTNEAGLMSDIAEPKVRVDPNHPELGRTVRIDRLVGRAGLSAREAGPMVETAANQTMSGHHEKFERLVERAQRFDPLPTAVVHPCDDVSLESAVEAARLGFVTPI